MIRKWMFAIVAFTSIAVNAQVGIGTVTPNALLELKAKDSNNPTNSEGILIPRVKKFPTVNPDEKHHGLLVFLSENTATHQAGFYHWSHTKKAWTHVAQDYAWSLKGNAGTNPAINFIGTTDNKPLVFKQNNLLIGYFDTSNISLGASTFSSKNKSSFNVTIGAASMAKNVDGSSNFAGGFASLLNNVTGSSNVAIGSYSGISIINSGGNVSIGSGSLQLEDLNFYPGVSNYNLAIGYNSGYNAEKGAVNTISVGAYASTIASHTIRIGNQQIKEIVGQVPWSNVSDARINDNIREDVPGLNFITKLRPVTYNVNISKQTRIEKIPHSTDFSLVYDSDISLEQIKQTGFIGQEVETAANAIGYNFNGVNKPYSSKGVYSLSYATFVAPLVKAVQEQQQQIDKLTQKITILENKINQIENSL